MRHQGKCTYQAAILVLLLLALIPVPAQTPSVENPRVAVFGFENSGGDSRQDYLSSLAEGILRYDLSVLAGIPLVERRSLDRVLREQELSFAGMADPATVAKTGGLLGASHLVLGDFAVVAGELSLTVHLVDAATGSAVTFRERGASEHVVHRVAEKLAFRLLGSKGFVFADASNDRSILSLRDETPGVILLHSPIRAAEIYLDEEFVGYTRGEALEPIVLESVRPGRRKLRVHLEGGDFGVVALPQVEFKDWETVIDVRPGARHAVRDPTRHFNDILYRLEYLESFKLKARKGSESSLAASRRLSFQDRSGRPVDVSFSVTPAAEAEALLLELSLEAGGAKASGRAAWPEKAGLSSRTRVVAGLVALEAELSGSGDSYEVAVVVRRTDVYQNMHRER